MHDLWLQCRSVGLEIIPYILSRSVCVPIFMHAVYPVILTRDCFLLTITCDTLVRDDLLKIHIDLKLVK